MTDNTSGTGLTRTIASTETLRLVELHTLDAFYTPLEERFERLTRICRAALRVPVAAVTVLGEGRQWFKSVTGWRVTELPLEQSLCSVTAAEGKAVVVSDTLEDSRFSSHPLVTGQPHFRFYAGVPLRDQHNDVIGTLCAMALKPKSMDLAEHQCMKDLATLTERELLTSQLRDGYAEMISRLGAARRQAMFDPLTRVWNRRGGLAMLRAAIKDRASRQEKLGVCVVDIDNFKRVNDLHGHQVGDQVLRKVARSLVASLRPDDVVCRLGGDEFLTVLPDMDQAAMKGVVARLRQAVNDEPVRTREGPVPVTVSVGGIVYRAEDPVEAEAALEAADKAMYESKRQGKNRVTIVPDPAKLADAG